MKRIDAGRTITYMSEDNDPVIYVENGDTITVEMQDCFAGKIRKKNELLKALPWNSINPATGPVYVKGAEPGDILKISILDIQIGDRAVILCEATDFNRYHFQISEKSMFVDIINDEAVISDKIKIKVRPMIGVIGTAPETGSVLTTLPGIHGGNMDNTHITTGSTLYLPVFHEGALLSLGDMHALMGDGEPTGSGLEISGRAIIKVDVVKNEFLPLPLLETESFVETIASAKSLDEASVLAVENMLTYLNKNMGIDKGEAWKLVAACGDVGICQFANAMKTARCCIPKTCL